MYLKDIPTDIVRLKESHGHRLRFLVYSIVCFVDYESLQCRDLSTLNEKYKDHTHTHYPLFPTNDKQFGLKRLQFSNLHENIGRKRVTNGHGKWSL